MSNSTGISRMRSGSVPCGPARSRTSAPAACRRRCPSARRHRPTRRWCRSAVCDRLMSLRIGSVCVMSAPHGGISRATTLRLDRLAPTAARPRRTAATSAPLRPGRWQVAHLLKMIGATSLAKVGAAAARQREIAQRSTLNDASAATPTTSNARRFMSTPWCSPSWPVGPCRIACEY